MQDANGLQTSLLNLGIGRYRQRLTEYFSAGLNPERPLRGLLQFAALYHDVGKRATQITRRRWPNSLHRSREGRRGPGSRACQAVQPEQCRSGLDRDGHCQSLAVLLPGEQGGDRKAQVPSRAAIYRFFRDTGPVAVGLIVLGLADLQGTREHLLTEKAWSAWVGVARSLLDNLWEKPQEAVTPPRLLDGNDLMTELALPPGPAIGQLLEAIREAQAAGEILDRKDAFAFARKWMSRSAGAVDA